MSATRLKISRDPNLEIKDQFVNKPCTLDGIPAIIKGWNSDCACVITRMNVFEYFDWDYVFEVMTGTKKFTTSR